MSGTRTRDDTYQYTEIVTQPITVPEEDAVERVSSGIVSRLKRLYSDEEVVRAERRFKPFYRFGAVLRKKFLKGDDIVHEGMIVVDASTGVARPILKQHVETTEKHVPESELIARDLSEDDALSEAQRQKLRTQSRDGGEIELDADADVVYKPVWLVEFADGGVKAVDATNGQVYDDMTIV
jgi:hypothetical protein